MFFAAETSPEGLGFKNVILGKTENFSDGDEGAWWHFFAFDVNIHWVHTLLMKMAATGEGKHL